MESVTSRSKTKLTNSVSSAHIKGVFFDGFLRLLDVADSGIFFDARWFL